MKTQKKSSKYKLRSIKKNNRKLKKHKKTKKKQKENNSIDSFIGLTLLGETGREIITELSSQKPVLKYKKSIKRDKLIRKRSGNLVIPNSEFMGTGVEYKDTCDHQEIYQNDLQKFNLKLLAIEIDEFFNIRDVGNIPGWWFPIGVPADTREYNIDNIDESTSEYNVFDPHINSFDPESFLGIDSNAILGIHQDQDNSMNFHIIIATLHESGVLHPKEYEKITHLIGANYQHDMNYIYDHLDTDGDGISDKDEGAYNNHLKDTDGDGTPDWLDNDYHPQPFAGVLSHQNENLYHLLKDIHHHGGGDHPQQGGGGHDLISPDQANHIINGYNSQLMDNIHLIQDVIFRAVGRQKFLCLYKPGYYSEFHSTMAHVISSTLNIHELLWDPLYNQRLSDNHHPQPDSPDIFVENPEIINVLSLPEEWKHYFFTVDGESIEHHYLQGEWFFDESESHDHANNHRQKEYHGKKRDIIDKLTESLHNDNHKILILSDKSQNSIVDKIHTLTEVEKHDIHIIVKPKAHDIVQFFKDEFKNNLAEYSFHNHDGLDHVNHLEFYGTEHSTLVIKQNMETERPIGHSQFNEIGYTIALATLYDNSEDTNSEIARGISYGHVLVTIAREGDGPDPDLPYKLRVQFSENVLKKDDYLCNQDYIKERLRGILHIMTRYLPLSMLKLLASHIGPGNDDQSYQNCLSLSTGDWSDEEDARKYSSVYKGKPCSNLELVNCHHRGLADQNSYGYHQSLLWSKKEYANASGVTAGGGGCDISCFEDLMGEDLDVFVHEFSHYIHDSFYVYELHSPHLPIEAIHARNHINEAYTHFMSDTNEWSGLGPGEGVYAKTNQLEFFAVTTTCWFQLLSRNSGGDLLDIEKFRTIQTSGGNYYDLLTQIYGPSINMKEELQSMNINVEHWNFR